MIQVSAAYAVLKCFLQEGVHMCVFKTKRLKRELFATKVQSAFRLKSYVTSLSFTCA